MPKSQDYRFTELDNGLRIVTEYMPSVRTASLGVWVESGSRCEKPGQEGMAHFWEHLAFKGTTTRSTHDIALDLDILGGLSNAFTGRESTCFHIRVAEKHFEKAFDITADLVLNPTPTDEETAREKEVVLQEISMMEETPEDKIHETFWEHIWDKPSLTHSILGVPETVVAFDRQNLLAWRAKNYVPSNMLVAAAGAVDHDRLVAMAKRAFAGAPAGKRPPRPESAAYLPRSIAIERDVEQNHVILSFPAVGNKDPRRFVQTVLSTVLGGNMSSRLFQEVREKRGLAYSIYAHINGLSDVAALQIQAAVDPARTAELLEVLAAELDKLATSGVTRDEFEHTREHLQGLLYLGSESTESRMMRLARNQILFGRHVPFEETAQNIQDVTRDELQALAAEILTPENRGMALLGPDIKPEWTKLIKP